MQTHPGAGSRQRSVLCLSHLSPSWLIVGYISPKLGSGQSIFGLLLHLGQNNLHTSVLLSNLHFHQFDVGPDGGPLGDVGRREHQPCGYFSSWMEERNEQGPKESNY